MRILLGVTGCIAAYKAVELMRLLQKQDYEVVVAMTGHAQKFVAPLTFAALSRHPVYSGMFEEGGAWMDSAENIDHVRLTHSISALAIAPATANILAKMAHGIADDFLSTLYLANTAPVIIAPAMNVNMWNHPATQANLRTLVLRGHRIVEPGEGYLAEGISGMGRLADLELIVEEVRKATNFRQDLAGKTILITAGPTCEDIDPVRFLSNRSSGKMGYALAEAAQVRGGQCLLVSGPTSLTAPPGVETIPVRSAQQMREAVLSRIENADIIIKAAAVADYRPIQSAPQKIKKSGKSFQLELVPTPDILSELGRLKGTRFLVGFAAETDHVRENALKKIKEKNLDLIVSNDVTQEGAGFEADTNIVTLYDRNGNEQRISLQPKLQVAHAILDRIIPLLPH
jgi:phosphopantothenoylcysteine decarboxylase/phosphopantothenate--cysteine ligase